MKPERRPKRPHFSSGPCAKRPGWSLQHLQKALLGRSHRAAPSRARLQAVIDQSRTLLGLPDDYRLAIVPASDTGAMEMAMWSLLGARGVDGLAWESFGRDWLHDMENQLGLEDLRSLTADYGELPDLGQVDFNRDVVFAWNGTTSGVRVPHADWIPAEREGLVICDATSALFAMEVPLEKLDVVTWSWQKVLGGEAGHGMLALSPKAVERLESYVPPRPLPKIFRMTQGGQLMEGLFKAATINTPSMLAVEDMLDALGWAQEIGGLQTLVARSEANLASVARWIDASDWARFLAREPAHRSCTSICLQIDAPPFVSLSAADRSATVKQMAATLEHEEVAFDIASYRDAPSGLRIWGGATVENSDIEALLPWLDWSFAELDLG